MNESQWEAGIRSSLHNLAPMSIFESWRLRAEGSFSFIIYDLGTMRYVPVTSLFGRGYVIAADDYGKSPWHGA